MTKSKSAQPKRHRRSRAEWQLMLASYASSGLSVKAYCRQQGIPEGSFYKWRNELSTAKDLVTDDTFMELSPPLAKSGLDDWMIELCWGPGMTLRLGRAR